jgi:hypothetical protein
MVMTQSKGLANPIMQSSLGSHFNNIHTINVFHE